MTRPLHRAPWWAPRLTAILIAATPATALAQPAPTAPAAPAGVDEPLERLTAKDLSLIHI